MKMRNQGDARSDSTDLFLHRLEDMWLRIIRIKWIKVEESSIPIHPKMGHNQEAPVRICLDLSYESACIIDRAAIYSERPVNA